MNLFRYSNNLNSNSFFARSLINFWASLILLFFFPFFPIQSEEQFTLLDFQAEALWEARDYTTAGKIYEQLLSRPLPIWQQARSYYNLGTIQLAQQHIIEALTFFQKIKPTDLSLPRFGRNLFLNEGIAYLKYAQILAHVPYPSFDQQALFIEQSLESLDQAQLLECQEQQEEQDSSFYCQPSFLLNEWIRAARLQLNAVRQQKRQNWMEQASRESLANLLNNRMQEWMDRLNALQIQKENYSFQASLVSYFQHQAESFTPLWNALQQKEFSLNQKNAFEQAITFYFRALQALNQQDLSSATEEWKGGMKALVPLVFQENKEWQQARLNYEILLLEEPLTISMLKELIAQFESLKVEKNQSAALKQIQENLRTSLKELKDHHIVSARFFLLAGFSQVNSLFQSKEDSPAAILQQALNQAHHTLLLSFLSEIMLKSVPKSEKIQAILKNQQEAILNQAAPFIPSVLEEQKMHFHQDCQQSPWDQVIPLYDQGDQAAQNAKKQLGKPLLDLQTLIAYQERTIQEWQQALMLILHPPQQTPAASTPQKLTETFRLIQEMYLQDQAQSEEKIEELYSW